MSTMFRKRRLIVALAITASVGVLTGCAEMRSSMSQMMHGQDVALTGSNEVPPVSTSASGNAVVTVNPDRTVSAKVTVSGMTPTASHIHEGAAGANGPVIVPFTKTGDNTFAAPDGAKLTEAQYAAYKAGNLYVNVHSAKNPGGEIRAQLSGK